MAALGAVAAAAACQANGATSHQDGPLLLTRGHMTNMLAPLPDRSFIAIPACVETSGGPQRVRLLSVAAGEVRGADPGTVEFLVAWPDQGDPLRVAAGPLRMLEEPFGAYQGSSGRVRPCGTVSPVTGLEVATVLPRAGDGAVVVEGWR